MLLGKGKEEKEIEEVICGQSLEAWVFVDQRILVGCWGVNWCW